MWQNTWQLREKRQPSSDRLPRKAAKQSRTLSEHQSVEAMVRTMKELIEDTAHTKLSATESITTWMIRHAAFLQTRFPVGKNGKTPFKRRHHKEYTSQLRPFGSAVDAKVRDEETESSKFDSRFIPASGLEEPQRAMSTLSEQHTVFTQQGRFERRLFKKSGTVASSRV